LCPLAAAKIHPEAQYGEQQPHPLSLPEYASMQLSRLFIRIALLLLPVALVGTTWLYFYPVLHGCEFPTPPSTHPQRLAPFRLLSLGDPQLEGDSSLPDPNALVFPSVENLAADLRDAADFAERRVVAQQAARGVVKDALRWLEGKRKAIDLWGNDWYLAHIVRSLRWWTRPTHVSVLGDLLGSQWITDGEFRKRAGRFWNIVMRGLEKVPDAIFGIEHDETPEAEPIEPTVQNAQQERGGEVDDAEAEPNLDENAQQEDKEEEDEVGEGTEEEKKPERKAYWGGTKEVLGADTDWEKRVINIAGNHDVGYAGDIDESRIDRFERAFGSVNWDIWFTLPDALLSNETADVSRRHPDRPPTLRLVILNSMNLDTPAWSSDLQSETYNFMNHIITTSLPVNDKTHATILLTHIPLEKEDGLCVDSPYFDFFESGHGVKEQNMLSGHSSKTVLEGIFGMSWKRYVSGLGMGRSGIIINGHDHAGCDVVHYIRQRGVEDMCQPEEIKREDAYWLTSTANETMIAMSMDIDSVDANVVAGNDTEPAPESSTESSEPVAESTPEPPLPTWRARRFPHRRYEITPENECTDINASPHIREITLRSMMGEYSGYAGFLSAWFDEQKGDRGEWVFEFSTCGLGIQHWWWGVHIVDLVLVIALLGAALARVVEHLAVVKTPKEQKTPVTLDKRDRKSVSGTTVYSSTSGRTALVTEVTERRI
jgi:hypothetical protein